MYPTVRNIFFVTNSIYVYLVETDKMMLIRLEFTYVLRLHAWLFSLGFLPDLDKRLNVFRPAPSEMSLWFILTTLFFTGATMTFYGYSTVAPTLILFLATLAFLYNNQNYGKRRKNFKGWKKLWPGNLLIPGMYNFFLMV